MSIVLETAKGVPGATAHRSEGVWQAAWRRLRADHVGTVSLQI